MPKRKAFIDSSVLIKGLLFEKTNSALILKLVSKNLLTEQCAEEMEKLRGTIKDKDLEHLAAARSSGIIIIAYDRDFDGLKEYFTPKELLKSMKMKTYDTLY